MYGAGKAGKNAGSGSQAGLEKIGGLFWPLLKPETFWLRSMCGLALGVYGWVPVFKKGPLAAPIKGSLKGLIVTFCNGQI